MNLLMLALAGAAGPLARFGLHGAAQRLSETHLPAGTLAVNALGSFLFGVIWSLAEERAAISPQTRQVLLVGFLGAFTTFSTFSFETGQLIRSGAYLAAAGNIAAQNALGIGLFLVGAWAGGLV